MSDSTRRFSSRVENYVKYRPSYPAEVVTLLAAECRLTPDALVADIGSGTGLLTELFLKRGYHVIGVEPNREMRAAGERLLANAPGFTSVDGTAEATTLATYGTDYTQVSHKQIDPATIGGFFAPHAWHVRRFENTQMFDFEGLKGRLLSSSYTPEPTQPRYQPMLDALVALFATHRRDDRVAFEYDTTVYYGQLR